MAELTALSAACKHKQQLERRYEALRVEEKDAQQMVQESQVRCQRENLDIRKFEENDFKQFWFKLRGQYEQRVLENNERATEAMRQLNDAKSHAFDIAREMTHVKEKIDALAGVEDDYKEALASHIEHLDYSIHRDEIIRMQEKISYDDYQLALLKEGRNVCELAVRRAEQLYALMEEMVALEAGPEDADDHMQIQFISGMSELRVLLHQLEHLIADIDALETERIQFSNKLSINTLDLFFNKGSEKLQAMANEKAFRELTMVRNSLVDGEKNIIRLSSDIEMTKELHRNQLETFIRETMV